jgi:acetylornithine deacetylase/succinyl-diaminopimelate desuccinylase-like protein
MTTLQAVQAYLDAHYEEGLEDLKAFCRIKSVSTDPAYRDGIHAAAGFVADRLTRAGFDRVAQLETGGHPAVYGEITSDPSQPTYLVYGHYDVQPPDPLDKWVTPPFEPTVRNDRLYARGVSDDKGPLLIPILVAEAFMRVSGKLPVNLKVLIEGEEEAGSPNFEATLARYSELLTCDAVISADGAMWRPDKPSLTVASRGMVAFEITVKGPSKDLHSGRHGGSAPNPITALVALLASFHGKDGRVAVDGFFDGTAAPDARILAAIEAANFDTAAYYVEIGTAKPDPIDNGRDLLLRQWLEPTLEFNGISGGYQREGSKAIIPSTASVKITCRLVAGQKPSHIAETVRRHLEQRLPPGISLEFHRHGPGSEAFFVNPDLPLLATAEDVLGAVLGQKPLRVAMGATVPIGSAVRKILDRETIFFSFSTSDEDYHAPNEFLRLQNFRIGLSAWSKLLLALGGDAAIAI